MSDTLRDRMRERFTPNGRGDREPNEMIGRLQSQINDLRERVTGVRKARRQAFIAGIILGFLVGLGLGYYIHMQLTGPNRTK